MSVGLWVCGRPGIEHAVSLTAHEDDHGEADTAGLWGKSFRAAVEPELILFVLLPPLLFESAFGMDWEVFKKVSASSLILAGPGVVLSVALTGLTTKAIFQDWDWSAAFMLGSILSATDPVAVVAVLHTLGAPKKLSHLIEGESLLNDGSAYVVFVIFKVRWQLTG